MEKTEETLVQQFSGPLLFHYVWWILQEAKKRSLNTLYFLARDGYILYQIAQDFCKKFQLRIECKYLYCSRASLRLPSYHLIGNEMYDLLLLGGYQVTLNSLLHRANITQSQGIEILNECGFGDWDPNVILSHKDLEFVRERIKENDTYREIVLSQSKEMFPATVGYFRQEGLFAQEQVAIVDSGWTGSMQRSLRQILQADGFQGQFIGFYFGMYARPKDPADGVYLTWYFNSSSRPTIKIPFCNNLFECLLSAPHGMTCGYKEENGIFIPVKLADPCGTECERIQSHIDKVLRYTNQRLSDINFIDFDEISCQKEDMRLIRRYMGKPTRTEVEVYGRFLFCDDTTESYHLRLADASQIEVLKGYSIPARIWRRFVSKKSKGKAELFWPFGTIALLPWWKRPWYYCNVYFWEWLRYTLH